MRKRILAAALAFLLLCACGSGGSKAAYTLEHSNELINSGAFEGSEMAILDAPVIPILYKLDPETITASRAYMATNTSVSADELVILILTDEEAAIAAEKACRDRVAAQLAVCESYCPAAVPRLEKAFISRRGNTVLMAVGDPDIIASLKGIQ